MLHVSLAVLGGARGTLRDDPQGRLLLVVGDWRSTSFRSAAPPSGAVWQVVVQVIGLRELHRTSTARAFWAWFLPFVVAICLAGALVFAAMFGLLKVLQEFGGGKFEV